jgi:two-component system nitrate/nitrite response regulator NarL
MDQIRILIVDDHSLFRQSLGRFLATMPGCRIVGQCGSASEAALAFSNTQADVVLLDFDLGDGHGGDLIAELRKHQKSAKVLMVTAGMPHAAAVKVMEDGASGIFLKHGTLDTLLRAVERVAAGDIWLDFDEVRAMMTSSLSRGDSPDRARTLTAINASESSVKAVIQELFRKAGVRTRSQLVRIAIEKHSSDWLQPETAESSARN